MPAYHQPSSACFTPADSFSWRHPGWWRSCIVRLSNSGPPHSTRRSRIGCGVGKHGDATSMHSRLGSRLVALFNVARLGTHREWSTMLWTRLRGPLFPGSRAGFTHLLLVELGLYIQTLSTRRNCQGSNLYPSASPLSSILFARSGASCFFLSFNSCLALCWESPRWRITKPLSTVFIPSPRS